MANATQTPNLDRGKWFQIYKPTQGYWTRMLTAIGGGALTLWGASWLFNKFSVIRSTEYGLLIQVAVAVVYIAVLGFLLYWAVGKNISTVDFFISVEGEMKKVNWTSRPEIIGSTKIVVLFVVLTSLMLFIVDTFFMLFFSEIGVLKGPGFISVFQGVLQYFRTLF